METFPQMNIENTIKKDGITIITAENPQQGVLVAKDILNSIIDENTVLYLSGGSQKVLYKILAEEGKIRPGAVAMVDDRFGPPYHRISNELTVRDTGFIDYLQKQGIPFYPILKEGLPREKVSQEYQKTIEDLLSKYSKHVAILGLGVDGHFAGIAPNRYDFENLLFRDKELFIGEFHDPRPMSEDGNPSPPNGFGERVTMTFQGISRMSAILLIAFGDNKKEGFDRMFSDRDREEVPGRFLLQPDIAEKTILITDQKI